MSTATTATTWTGWHRPRNGAWRKLVTDAPSAADCWGRLLEALASQPSGDGCVLESFRRPGATARPFAACSRMATTCCRPT